MNILIACEESQEICKSFRNKGYKAYSCDILPCSGGSPEWHIKNDALKIIRKRFIIFKTQDNKWHFLWKWHIMIAHPPCTHLSVSGARWFKENKKPIKLQNDAAEFFMKLINAPIKKIAVENPVCVMSTKYRKPDQIINPFQFGHPEQKKTCLWLKNLPKLKETNNVYDYMMTLPIKERTRIHWLGSGKSKERSKTYPGIAKAISEQWQ